MSKLMKFIKDIFEDTAFFLVTKTEHLPWYLCFLCPEFGLLLLLILAITYVYKRELNTDKNWDEEVCNIISQIKSCESRIADNMMLKDKCVELLNAEQGSLSAMVDYTGMISAQVLPKCLCLPDLGDPSYSSCEIDDIVEIQETEEIEVIEEVISETIGEELSGKLEKIDELLEIKQIVLSDEIMDDVEIYKEVIEVNEISISGDYEEQNIGEMYQETILDGDLELSRKLEGILHCK